MPQKRKTPAEITARNEDAGLFCNALCQVIVELIPVLRQNRRNDTVVAGFVSGDLEIEVLFAGRRRGAAAPLIAALEQVRRKRLQAAVREKQPPPAVETMRLGVQVEGAWRPRFQADEDGWETRSYHLVAARWSLGADGPLYGQPPAH